MLEVASELMTLPSTPLLGFLYSMGTQENLHCVKGISYFKLTNDQGDEINSCYAAMVKTENFIIPYKIHIDRYVVATVDSQKNDAGSNYYELDSEWKEGLQSEGYLPALLPEYQIGMDSYLPAIGLGLLFIGYVVYMIWQSISSSQKSEDEASSDEQSEKE